MKLLQELTILHEKHLLSISEEAIEKVLASDLWKENKSSAKTYISSVIYSVKKKSGDSDTPYEIYKDDAKSKRVLVGKFSLSDLEASYVPVRANQKEDAEGYILYRDIAEVDAFKYDGDTIKVDLEGETGKLKKGDYLIRASDGDNFTYSIESAKYFDGDYTEKK